MDLRHVRYFVALYEEQSVTRAASRLNVVQPAVSTQIRNLESEFGVMLFERTPHGVFPTGIARTLYPTCVRILEALAAARRTLEDASGKVTGTVTIGVPPSMAQGLLSEYLVVFNAAHPNIHVRCYEGYSGHLLDWLRQGILDFAIVNSASNDPRLKTRALWTEDLIVAWHEGPDHAVGNGFPARDLLNFKLILTTTGNYLRALIDAELAHLGSGVLPTLEVDSLTAVLQMLKTPGWATIVPEMALWGSREAAGLSSARLIEPSIRRSLLAVFHPVKELSLAGEKFIEGLESVLRDRSRAEPLPAMSA